MSKIKEKIVNIIFLGGEGVGKSEFISNYLSKLTTVPVEKPECKEIKKIIGNYSINITIYEYSVINDKIIQIINKCHCAFIIFNMTSRESFDDLYDRFLITLRDVCKFEGMIIILGNYFSYDSTLSTNKDEIQELINVSQTLSRFYEIGNKNNDEKVQLIDSLITEAIEFGLSKTKGESKKCIIY